MAVYARSLAPQAGVIAVTRSSRGVRGDADQLAGLSVESLAAIEEAL